MDIKKGYDEMMKFRNMMIILENLAEEGFLEHTYDIKHNIVVQGDNDGISFTPYISEPFNPIAYSWKIKEKFVELEYDVVITPQNRPRIFYKSSEDIRDTFEKCFITEKV